MKTSFSFASIAALIAAAVLQAAPASALAQQSRALKLNHTDTPSGVRHKAAELFARKVGEYSGGKLRVLVFHSGQLGNDPQSITQVTEGKLDFTVSATGSYAGLHKPLNLTALPYLVDGYEQGWALYDNSPWMRKQFEQLQGKGLRVLSTWEAGFRSFTTTKPLTKPADAAGEKMRVFPNEMIKWVMESLKFEPITLPVGEVYLAIKSGKVYGQENPIDTINALRFYEVAPHITLTQHVYSPLPFVISEATWKTLSAAERTAVQRAAAEASALSRQTVKESDQKQLESMQAKGAKVTRPDVAAFKAAMASVYDKARGVYGADVDELLKDAQAIAKTTR